MSAAGPLAPSQAQREATCRQGRRRSKAFTNEERSGQPVTATLHYKYESGRRNGDGTLPCSIGSLQGWPKTYEGTPQTGPPSGVLSVFSVLQR